MEQQRISNQFGTPVTTGHTSKYDWSAKSGHRSRVLPNTVSPLPANYARQFSDCAPSLQSSDTELLHFPFRNTYRKNSDSMESMQQDLDTHIPTAVSDPDSVSITETEDSGDDYADPKIDIVTIKSEQSPTSLRVVLSKMPKEKRKVGRPIAYRGDPNSPELTEQERRRIKRRIANRESARRVRHKRQEMLDELQIKIDSLQAQNADLKMSMNESKQEKDDLSQQLREVTVIYNKTLATNANMQLELESLRTSLQMRMTALEIALDRQESEKQENGSDNQEIKTIFGSAQAQSMPGFNTETLFPSPLQGDFKGSLSYQLAIQNYPSFQLGERSVELLPNEHADLALITNNAQLGSDLPT